MPRIRIVPVLLKRGPSLVKGASFAKSRVIGPALPSVRIYQSRNVDELVVIDVSGSVDDSLGIKRFEWIKEVNSFLTMPLSIGGGVRSISQIQYLIQNGADRVLLNWALRHDKHLVKKAVSIHGGQSIVGSIDVLFIDGVWHVYDSWQLKPLDLCLASFISEVQDLGVGEILLTSHRCEGQMKGFDLDLLENIVGLVSVPLIFQGGAGSLIDFYHILKSAEDIGVEISAIAASSCFHFTQLTPGEVSKYLKDMKFDTRIANAPF